MGLPKSARTSSMRRAVSTSLGRCSSVGTLGMPEEVVVNSAREKWGESCMQPH